VAEVPNHITRELSPAGVGPLVHGFKKLKGPEVVKDVEEHRYSPVPQAHEVGLSAQRDREDSDRRTGELGCRPAPQAGPSIPRAVGGVELANSAAALPSEERSPSTGRV
jgi:hypothetical protein